MSAFNAFNPNSNSLASNSNARPTIELTMSRFEKPMEVDLEGFFEFSFDLAEDLLDLEAQFRPRRQISSNRSPRTRATKSV